MKLKLKLPWFAQDEVNLATECDRELDTLSNYAGVYVAYHERFTVDRHRRALVNVLVKILKSIELEVDITPEELSQLDVQVLEHVAIELMGKVAERKQ